MDRKLAVDGGTPVRSEPLPYARQSIDDDDLQAVAQALRSDWLTTGPRVEEFERSFAAFVGASHAVAVNSGTAALHAAAFAAEIGPGDEVIVPPLTFAATANVVVYQGGTPVFADVDADTLLLDPASVERLLTPRTKAIIAVDYAGQPCDYEALRRIAARQGIRVIADACHAPGGSSNGEPVGRLAHLNTFSFHPAKHITTGEGGIITTEDANLARRMRVFRNHGITSDHRQRESEGSWFYEMVDLGWNYRLTDFQCALGTSQLRKLSGWVTRRREIAAKYEAAFRDVDSVRLVVTRAEARHAFHFFPVRIRTEKLSAGRATIFRALRAEGIQCNVHYVPVHLHPYYRNRFGTGPGLCPNAEQAYEELLTLPLFPSMTDGDVADVIAAVIKVVTAYHS